MRARGLNVPIVADIHFSPKLAMLAVEASGRLAEIEAAFEAMAEERASEWSYRDDDDRLH